MDRPRPVPEQIRLVASLASDFTLEVTPKEVLKQPGLLAEVLPPGTRVYTTFLANTSFADTVAAAAAVRSQGMRPVPHLAARNVLDYAELDRMVGELAAAGVDELLVIAGSLKHPAGEISESLQILTSGALQRHGIRRVGVAGHPEGNTDIGDDRLAKALQAKNEFAAESGCDVYLLTQFCFAPEPIIEWERRIRAVGNRLPVHVGLPGLTSPVSLVKFGLACGVGPSLKVLRKQSGGVLRLATKSVYFPDQTLLGLARSIAADPESLIRKVHFFPFGAVAPTSRWVSDIAGGRFAIDDQRDRVTVAEATG
jgi:methylenetetrahydrofolate reductase (NADPH)